MVEMSETANILHNATADSLVLMDEVGRGTSRPTTASRWRAPAPMHLATSNRAFTLFATHYFELTELAGAIRRHRERASRRGRIRRAARLHARGQGRPGEPQLRPAGRRARRAAEAVIADAKRTLAELERGMHQQAAAPVAAAESARRSWACSRRRSRRRPSARWRNRSGRDDAARGAGCAVPVEGAGLRQLQSPDHPHPALPLKGRVPQPRAVTH